MKRTLLLLGMCMSMLSAIADDNVLQSIEIVPVKDTYNIVLTSDKVVDIKKSVQASNKITLNLKEIRASKNLNTIYNNVSNVDAVMVEPNGSGLSIFFQADNAQNASITFDTIAPAKTITKNTQTLKLSSPIESYAPIYREEQVVPKTSAFFDKLINKSNTVQGIQDSIDEDTVPDTVNKTISWGLIGLLAFAVIRLFKRKEPEIKIGLSQSLNEREIQMYKGAQPIGTAYSNTEKPFTTVNYGLNAYQKENKNPYETMPIHNPRLRSYANSMHTVQSVPQQVQTFPSASIHHTSVQQAVKKAEESSATDKASLSNVNIDNLKFLESMTAIYEKSGRHDLAQGLKKSLNKNNVM